MLSDLSFIKTESLISNSINRIEVVRSISINRIEVVRSISINRIEVVRSISRNRTEVVRSINLLIDMTENKGLYAKLCFLIMIEL